VTLSGCAATAPVSLPSGPGEPGGHSSLGTPSSVAPSPSHPRTASKHTVKPSPSRSRTTTASGPRIVSFRIAQRPKCAEGTAVFRAPAVPLVIAWKISGATGGALSVDDPTHTPGTYGSVDLEGRMEFPFSCAGGVGTTETHTYALYTVGGGPTRSASLTASAKVLDQGK
jgi:hypothetical protein